jgi:hypothetical protein
VPKEKNGLARAWAERREYMLAAAARGKRGRPMHVADGYSKETIEYLLAIAKVDADRILRVMEDEKLIEPVTEALLDSEKLMSREALSMAIILMRMPGNVKDKLAAARTILEYTRAKPAQATDMTIRSAESFLDELSRK